MGEWVPIAPSILLRCRQPRILWGIPQEAHHFLKTLSYVALTLPSLTLVSCLVAGRPQVCTEPFDFLIYQNEDYSLFSICEAYVQIPA